MHAHNNVARVTFEIIFLVAGVPLLGAISCALLLHRTRGEGDSDRRQYQRVGLGATGYAFVQQLTVLAANFLPQRFQTFAVVLWLPLFALTGVLAAATGAVLIVKNGQGADRYAGFLVSLLAIAYSAATILAFLAGGL